MKLIHIVEVIDGNPNIFSFRLNQIEKAKKLFHCLAMENDVAVNEHRIFTKWNASDYEGYDLVVASSNLNST
jgi:hypothetical protein